MTDEIYKLIDTYYVGIDSPEYMESDLSHKPITLKAVVLSLKGHERLFIRYSHAGRSKGAGGIWYSDSCTNATDIDHARALIETYAKKLSRCVEIVPWSEDI